MNENCCSVQRHPNMEAAGKKRRRCSIRNLNRLSTSVLAPPGALLDSTSCEEKGPCYGSAWLEEGQDTNMDNLVKSFSQLVCAEARGSPQCVQDRQESLETSKDCGETWDRPPSADGAQTCDDILNLRDGQFDDGVPGSNNRSAANSECCEDLSQQANLPSFVTDVDVDEWLCDKHGPDEINQDRVVVEEKSKNFSFTKSTTVKTVGGAMFDGSSHKHFDSFEREDLRILHESIEKARSHDNVSSSPGLNSAADKSEELCFLTSGNNSSEFRSASCDSWNNDGVNLDKLMPEDEDVSVTLEDSGGDEALNEAFMSNLCLSDTDGSLNTSNNLNRTFTIMPEADARDASAADDDVLGPRPRVLKSIGPDDSFSPSYPSHPPSQSRQEGASPVRYSSETVPDSSTSPIRSLSETVPGSSTSPIRSLSETVPGSSTSPIRSLSETVPLSSTSPIRSLSETVPGSSTSPIRSLSETVLGSSPASIIQQLSSKLRRSLLVVDTGSSAQGSVTVGKPGQENQLGLRSFYMSEEMNTKKLDGMNTKKSDSASIKEADGRSTKESRGMNDEMSDGMSTKKSDGMRTKKSDGMSTKKSDGMNTKKYDGMSTKKSDGMSTKKSDGMSTEKSDGMSKNKSDGMSTKKSDGMSTKKSDGKSTKKSDGMSTKKSDGMSTKKLDVSTEKSDGMSTKKSDGMSTKKSDGMSTKKSDGMSTKKSGGMSTKKSEGMNTKKSDGMSTEKSDGMGTEKSYRMNSKESNSASTKKSCGMSTKKSDKMSTEKSYGMKTKKSNSASTKKSDGMSKEKSDGMISKKSDEMRTKKSDVLSMEESDARSMPQDKITEESSREPVNAGQPLPVARHNVLVSEQQDTRCGLSNSATDGDVLDEVYVSNSVLDSQLQPFIHQQPNSSPSLDCPEVVLGPASSQSNTGVDIPGDSLVPAASLSTAIPQEEANLTSSSNGPRHSEGRRDKTHHKRKEKERGHEPSGSEESVNIRSALPSAEVGETSRRKSLKAPDVKGSGETCSASSKPKKAKRRSMPAMKVSQACDSKKGSQSLKGKNSEEESSNNLIHPNETLKLIISRKSDSGKYEVLRGAARSLEVFPVDNNASKVSKNTVDSCAESVQGIGMCENVTGTGMSCENVTGTDMSCENVTGTDMCENVTGTDMCENMTGIGMSCENVTGTGMSCENVTGAKTTCTVLTAEDLNVRAGETDIPSVTSPLASTQDKLTTEEVSRGGHSNSDGGQKRTEEEGRNEVACVLQESQEDVQQKVSERKARRRSSRYFHPQEMDNFRQALAEEGDDAVSCKSADNADVSESVISPRPSAVCQSLDFEQNIQNNERNAPASGEGGNKKQRRGRNETKASLENVDSVERSNSNTSEEAVIKPRKKKRKSQRFILSASDRENVEPAERGGSGSEPRPKDPAMEVSQSASGSECPGGHGDGCNVFSTDDTEESVAPVRKKPVRTKRNRKSWDLFKGQTQESEEAGHRQLRARKPMDYSVDSLSDEEKPENLTHTVEASELSVSGYVPQCLSPTDDCVPQDLENLYCNKNYVPPTSRVWETIKEHPTDPKQPFNKQRFRRYLPFEDRVPMAKLKRREKKALTVFSKQLMPWTPMTHEMCERKLMDLYLCLDSLSPQKTSL